jgi:hypothetical protein
MQAGDQLSFCNKNQSKGLVEHLAQVILEFRLLIHVFLLYYNI